MNVQADGNRKLWSIIFNYATWVLLHNVDYSGDLAYNDVFER